MAQPIIKLEKPLLDFLTRQVPVFEEVIENFQVKCCDEHQPQRQKIVNKVIGVLRVLKQLWEDKEAEEHEKLLEFAEISEGVIEDVMDYKNNCTYHKFALIMAQWCLKLSKIQSRFQQSHRHQLLTVKMPPGSHEVSPRQFRMNLETAMNCYTMLSSFNQSLPRVSPEFILIMNVIISICRTHPNPIVYHMVSLFMEELVREANRRFFQLPI